MSDEHTMSAEQAFKAALELYTCRVAAADKALAGYDLGDEAIVSEAGSWDSEDEEDGITVLMCTLYLEADVDGDGRLSFKVRFPKDSAEPCEVFALTMGSGAEIGSPGMEPSTPSP